MKKYLIGLLAATTLLSSTAIVAKADTMSKLITPGVNISTTASVSQNFTINNSNVDENGTVNLKVSFNSEEYNSVLVIYDNGKEIRRTKLMPPSKEFNVQVNLTEYGTHFLTAKLGLTQGPAFDAYAQSNEISVGYFNPKLTEKIALSYIDENKENYDFNIVLPRADYNSFVAIYDNGNLLYRTKLVKPTDKVTFNSALLGSGRHDIKAYVGLTQGKYFEPYMTSNTITIFK